MMTPDNLKRVDSLWLSCGELLSVRSHELLTEITGEIERLESELAAERARTEKAETGFKKLVDIVGNLHPGYDCGLHPFCPHNGPCPISNEAKTIQGVCRSHILSWADKPAEPKMSPDAKWGNERTKMMTARKQLPFLGTETDQ